ncbi:MAG: tetraacyldisaccharide 4'-kinase [Hydrogenophilales bacterium 17-61-9]|nr:MAG: tetraacyldisaccharide 4'-kinase [Hydrogenophilales bacterium 17-61-9]
MFSLQHVWARTGVLAVLLSPLALLFTVVSGLRRLAYRRGWLKAISVGVPVIIVGNITAGGSGKTPLVIWLVNWLRSQGYRPGVVSRGYGGSARGCVEVRPDSLAAEVGDEPLLIRAKTSAPVVVGRDRVAAARMLIAHHQVDLIVADDGLQHYRLHRDIELAVVDAATGLGNGWPLPAGPLREPKARLRSVDAVIQVVRGAAQPADTLPAPAWRADYTAGKAYRLCAPQAQMALRDLPRHDWLAITGIGHPQGFFDMLEARGLRFSPRIFADHHAFKEADLPVGSAVLMTEKDAVKCRGFAGPDWWAVELDVSPESGFIDWLGARIKQ